MASGSGGSQKQPSAHSSSSDADVIAVSEGLTNLSMSGGEDFKRLLECPICMEILDAPIYQCRKGHTICNTCKQKLMKCPSCEAPVKDTRNLALESILLTLSFSCNHHLKGCNVVLKIQDLQEHHEKCEFRQLKCHLSDKDDCNGTLLYLADTLNHLKDTHKLRTATPTTFHPNTFMSGSRLYLSMIPERLEGDVTLLSELFHFDENDFVSLVRRYNSFTFVGFYLIGSKSDESKYSVKITFENHEAVWKHEVTTRFTSIRSFQEDWKENKLPEELVIDPAGMHRDRIISLKETNQTNPKWDLKYQINKI